MTRLPARAPTSDPRQSPAGIAISGVPIGDALNHTDALGPCRYWNRPVIRRLGLLLILAVASALYLVHISSIGLGNPSYTAAALSMSHSLHTWFYGAFDPAGYLSIDKPAPGLWPLALVVRAFGVHPLTVLLPQAIESLACVALLYALVRQTCGSGAGLLAALTLALTPTSVAIARSNHPDALAILLLLIATWFCQRGVQRDRTRELLVAALFLGAAFNVKTLQAALAAPPLLIYYLVSSHAPPRRRTTQIAAATAVFLIVSFAWIAVVSLTPAHSRPYVGDTTNNSELALTLGANGLDRILGGGFEASFSSPLSNVFAGAPGPLRFLDTQVATQVSWLIPLAIFGAVALWFEPAEEARRRSRRGFVVLWGSWAVLDIITFSLASGIVHPYYTAQMAPAIAALVGGGLPALWRSSRRRHSGVWRFAAPMAFALSAVFVVSTVLKTDYEHWLAPIIAVAAAVGVAAMLLKPKGGSALVALGVTVGVLGLYAAPAKWSADAMTHFPDPNDPTAGPDTTQLFTVQSETLPQETLRAASLGLAEVAYGTPPEHGNRNLEEFLLTHRGHTHFLLATTFASEAAPYIIDTDQPVMALGGFTGDDPIFTVNGFKQQIAHGQVRYVLTTAVPIRSKEAHSAEALFHAVLTELPQLTGGFRLSLWIAINCALVPEQSYGYQYLYDCTRH
jgi:4-amino-4-deoxy-L-arabinose transferase-like glycosyltransferase